MREWFAQIGQVGDISVIHVPGTLNQSVSSDYLAAELAANLDGDRVTIASATQLRE